MRSPTAHWPPACPFATDQIVTSDINYSGAEAANFSDYAAGIDATDKQQVSDAMGNLEFNPNGSEQNGRGVHA